MKYSHALIACVLLACFSLFANSAKADVTIDPAAVITAHLKTMKNFDYQKEIATAMVTHFYGNPIHLTGVGASEQLLGSSLSGQSKAIIEVPITPTETGAACKYNAYAENVTDMAYAKPLFSGTCDLTGKIGPINVQQQRMAFLFHTSYQVRVVNGAIWIDFIYGIADSYTTMNIKTEHTVAEVQTKNTESRSLNLE